MMIKYAMIAGLVLTATSSVAQSVSRDVDFSKSAVQEEIALVCTFTTECIDAEACEETTFSGTLVGRGGGATQNDLAVVLNLQSDSGDQELIGSAIDGTYKLMNIMGNANHMMTIAPDQTAHYSMHLPDVPMALTYIGACKEGT